MKITTTPGTMKPDMEELLSLIDKVTKNKRYYFASWTSASLKKGTRMNTILYENYNDEEFTMIRSSAEVRGYKNFLIHTISFECEDLNA